MEHVVTRAPELGACHLYVNGPGLRSRYPLSHCMLKVHSDVEVIP